MSRIRELSKHTSQSAGDCVIYLMSRDQRVRDNHALLAAQHEALERKLPLIVVFNLYTRLGNRKREHFEFMIAGLKEVEAELKKKDIPFVLTIGSMPVEVAELSKQLNPTSIYCDFSPLRHARQQQKRLAARVECRVAVVDTHNVVPVWVTSDKEEFAAHTIRRKLHRNIADWTVEPEPLRTHPFTFPSVPRGKSWSNAEQTLSAIPMSGIRHDFTPGEAAARSQLQSFVESGLSGYASGRNDPLRDAQSNLSPYLHFGQISALRVLLEVLKDAPEPPQLFRSHKMPSVDGEATKQDGVDAFIEELIVRKELSDNFCFYNEAYDSLAGAKDWAKKTLHDHADDPREFVYTKRQLEAAETHDDLWNAAQNQLVRTGKIHGYMRMYWAKKILEWTNAPATAISWACQLNDTYHLDGGDPNGYVGVMWSCAGVHDRPWFNRSVYGTVRYMAKSGAEKKFDVAAYTAEWS